MQQTDAVASVARARRSNADATRYGVRPYGAALRERQMSRTLVHLDGHSSTAMSRADRENFGKL